MRKFLCCIAMGSILSADPLMTYIGTKAKGMGGAFTAVANNNSAMYFNPAGLVSFDAQTGVAVTLELGTGAKVDQRSLRNTSASPQERYDALYDTAFGYFAGGSWIQEDFGLGIAYYSLYQLDLLQRGTANIYREDINVVSLSAAYAAVNKYLSFGLTLGIADSGFVTASTDDYEELQMEGFFIDIGSKMRIYNGKKLKCDLALNYRSKAELKDNSDTIYQTTLRDYTAVGIPEELTYAAAMMYSTSYGMVTLAVDYKDTRYSDVTVTDDFYLSLSDFTTTAVGLDFSNEKYQFRVGNYVSKATEKSGSFTTLTNGFTFIDEVNGYTFGGGMVLDEKGAVSLEASYDRRTYKVDTIETTESFISVSLNLFLPDTMAKKRGR